MLDRIPPIDSHGLYGENVLDNAQVIANCFADNLHFRSFAHDSEVVNIFGDTGVMTGHSTSVLEYKGQLFNAPRLYTDVLIRMGGRWQLVAHHVSELRTP